MDGDLEACIFFLSHVLLPCAATDSLSLNMTPSFSRKRCDCSGHWSRTEAGMNIGVAVLGQ